MYRVIEYIKRPKFNNWEGAIIEDQEGRKFITNGVYIWEARPERLETCIVVETIDIQKFYDYWQRNINIKLL